MNFNAAGSNTLMNVGRLSCVLNMPDALKSQGQGENEIAWELPPYRPRAVYLVDEYPACPAEWMRSSGRTKSYFVPIKEGKGMWLDFNQCLGSVPQHIAVVVSVQGINAVTGQPCSDPALEQYRDECPKHKKPFGPDRLCAECNFKWPKQNYLASTGTPQGALWLDGFRAEDGHIRQYVFTAAEARGVAKAIIGERRVHALGISFFLGKETRPQPQIMARRLFDSGLSGGMKLCSAGVDAGVYGSKGASGPSGDEGMVTYSASVDSMTKGGGQFGHDLMERSMTASASLGREKLSARRRESVGAPIAVKKLEVAAGARIKQQIYDDPQDLEYWQKEPEGLLIVNYCSEQEAERIVAAGKVNLDGSPEGFLQQVPVGNP